VSYVRHDKRGFSVARFSGMIGLDSRCIALRCLAELGYFLKLLQTITAKTVASPYFAANDFAFAYAKA
jgi:hypothetical protein